MALYSIFKYLLRKKRWITSEENVQMRTLKDEKRRIGKIAAVSSDQRKVLGGESAMSSQEKK